MGLRTWDGSGNLIVDTNTRLSRVLGIIDITSTPGSLTDAGFATGTPFAYQANTVPYAEYDPLSQPSYSALAVSWSGNTMTWKFLENESVAANFADTTAYLAPNKITLIYGVY